jgi:peptidoglycan hydrolase CwlO-like protein
MGTNADRAPAVRPRSGRSRRAPWPAAVLGALAVAAAGPGSAAAESVPELEAKAAAAQEQARELAGTIESQTGALLSQRQRAGAAGEREAQLSATLESGRQRAAELGAEVDQARGRLAEARSRLQRSVRVLTRRLVAIYKAGGIDSLGLLLDSDGYDDLAARAEYLDRIQDADAALIARTRELREDVAAELEAVTAARERQAAHNAELEAARDGIAAVRARAEASAASLATSRSRHEAALAELRARIEDWRKEIQRAQRISAAAAQQQVDQAIGEWPIPEQIVLCESGGDWGALNPASGAGGAFQILPSTWKAYGGEGLPHEASPAEQTRIATLIWQDSGAAAWECAA